MDHQRRVLRAGAAVILLAISLRLAGGGIFQSLAGVWDSPGLLSFFLYLQTGRTVRYFPAADEPQAATVPQETVPETTAPPQEPAVVTFSGADMELVGVNYSCDYRPDLESLLLSPLQWDLTAETPTVLIVHTHATESYAQKPGAEYAQWGAYRSLDAAYNMISIGEEVARILESGGIRVIHDKTLHDYPSYNDSYANARETILGYLEEYPDICLVLDIHRDASDGSGGQLVTAGTVGGQKSAQLMMVVGTDTTGNYFPNWQENLSLALKLTALLEQTDPGLTRPISLREHRFNMDLTPGSLIVEVGAAGNTHDEAVLAANALARAILTLANGTQ